MIRRAYGSLLPLIGFAGVMLVGLAVGTPVEAQENRVLTAADYDRAVKLLGPDLAGDVIGDLNSRRGRLQGMEPAGGMTTIKAEVPMAEILTYSQALTSMTGGRGDYTMHFLRYEEVPTHVAQKIIEQTKREREEAKV